MPPRKISSRKKNNASPGSSSQSTQALITRFLSPNPSTDIGPDVPQDSSHKRVENETDPDHGVKTEVVVETSKESGPSQQTSVFSNGHTLENPESVHTPKISTRRRTSSKNAASGSIIPRPKTTPSEQAPEPKKRGRKPKQQAIENKDSERPATAPAQTTSSSRRRSARASGRRSYSGMAEDVDDSEEEYQGAEASDDGDDDFVGAREEEEDDGSASRANSSTKPKSISNYPRKSVPKDQSKATELSKKRKMHGSILTQVQVVAGHDRESTARVVEMREHWDNYMFIPGKMSMGVGMVMPSAKFGVPVRLERTDSENSDTGTQKLISITFDEAQKYMIRPDPNRIIINDQEVSAFNSILIHESGELSGSILNAGGVITSISWAQGMADPHKQYIAVGLLDDNNRHPINSSVIEPEISIFSKIGYPSSFYIYQVDLSPTSDQKPIMKLVYTISSNFGSCIKLEWRPVNSGSDILEGTLGHLATITQDGKLRVYEIPIPDGTETAHLYVKSPFREYSIGRHCKFTTFCWRTPEVLVAATSNGHMVEYDIADSVQGFGSFPSYQIAPFDSAIACLASGYPNNPTIVFASSTDGFSCIYDTRNPSHRNYNHRRKGYSMASAYSSHFEAFATSDDNHYTQISFLRFFKAHMYSNSLTKHKALVTSIATSPYHPFVVTGGADGTVIAGNVTRRVLARKRVKNQPYEQGILWSVDYSSKEDKYSVKELYDCSGLEKPKILPIQQIYPQNVAVRDVKWSTCFETAEWYAAATLGGIIKIHRLIG